MNAIVFLHAVRDPTSFTVNRRAQKVFVNRENWIINPADKNALEAALALEADITVVAVGGAQAEDALRQALAMGAQRAVLVNDAILRNADACVLTHVLHRLVIHLGPPDLILLGAETLDSDTSQIGPRLAQALDWPLVGDAHQLSVKGAALTAIVPVGREFHRYEASLPVVVTMARGSNKPRHAPGARLITIYTTPDAVQTLTCASLDMPEAELTPVTEFRGESFPPERELGRKLEGDVKDLARQVAAVIRQV